MDTPSIYTGSIYKQHISRREIEKMKKNMKKVPIIQLKKEIYHKQEEDEADNILKNIPQEHPNEISNIIISTPRILRYKKLLHIITHYFTSSK